MINPINIYRLSHLLHRKSFNAVAIILRNLNFLLFKTYLPPSCQIGKGTLLGYKGMSVVIHSSSVIGENCVIAHGVTIGTAVPYTTNQPLIGPRIGSNTFIGAGAMILGNIEVGSNCTIAAGAIVLKSLSDNSIVVGVPAKIVGTNSDDYRAIRMTNSSSMPRFK